MTALLWMCRVYRALLRAYPSEFRESYAEEMARTFRDRGREIARMEGTRGLVRYCLSTGADWARTVLQERMNSMHLTSFSALRWILLCCIALDLVQVKQKATPTTVAATLPFALLIMYGLLVVLLVTTNRDGRAAAVMTETSMGLVSGLVMVVWTTVGNFVKIEGSAAVLLGCSAMAIIFGCWSVAGYRAVRRTGAAGSGWLAGCWSGVVCVLIKVTCALLLLNLAVRGPSIGDVFTAAGQHLLEGPVIGAVLGALGGFAARIAEKTRSPQAQDA